MNACLVDLREFGDGPGQFAFQRGGDFVDAFGHVLDLVRDDGETASGGAGAGADLALLALSTGAVLAGIDAFGDDEAIVSRAAISDSGWVLVGDYSEFSGQPNRVAAVRIDGDTLADPVLVDDVYDPAAVVPNPVGPGALVPSGYGDRYWLLGEDPDGTVPWFLAGQVQEGGQAGVQIPDGAVAITRGVCARFARARRRGARGARQQRREDGGRGRKPRGAGCGVAEGGASAGALGCTTLTVRNIIPIR